jgi:hypothetical protein
MKQTLLALATVLVLSSSAFAQYDYPGPPMWDRSSPDRVWRYGAPRWQRNYFEPRYQTDPDLCIRTGYCVDPRRPRMPQFPRNYYDNWE